MTVIRRAWLISLMNWRMLRFARDIKAQSGFVEEEDFGLMEQRQPEIRTHALPEAQFPHETLKELPSPNTSLTNPSMRS